MTTKKVRTHWILGDEVLSYNWLSTLDHVTSIMYNPPVEEMQQFSKLS